MCFMVSLYVSLGRPEGCSSPVAVLEVEHTILFTEPVFPFISIIFMKKACSKF